MSVKKYGFWATATQTATFYGCSTEAEFPAAGLNVKDLAFAQDTGVLKKRNAGNTAWVAFDAAGGSLQYEVTAATIPALIVEARSQVALTTTVTKSVIDALGIDAATLNGLTAAQIQAAVTAAIVDASPATLDTLNELAAALGDDANFATTITNELAGKQPLDADLTALAGLDSTAAGMAATDGAGWIKKTYAQVKTALGLVKADVGLGNVDNTSDAAKPVSTATQAALDAKQPLDADLTAIAALDSATPGMAASDGAGWIKKTYAQVKTALGLVKADVGLASVDNTSDANKPVSIAQQAAIDAEASARSAADALLIPLSQKAAANGVATLGADSLIPTAQIPALAINDTFTVASEAAMLALTAQRGDFAIRTDFGPARSFALAGDDPTVLANWLEVGFGRITSVNGQTGIVVIGKADVGLGNADNTSDASKPVSTATQTALDGKQSLDTDLTAIAGLDSSTPGAIASDGAGWVKKTYAQFKTALGLVKADVGLGNVDNTTDAGKPISTATQAALDLKAAQADLDAHLTDTSDAHDASAVSFVPAGTIASTNVQAAIEEVAAEAGGGITGTTEKDVCTEGFKESGTFDITGLAGLTIGAPVSVWQIPGPYTGKGTLTDDPEMDMLVVSAYIVSATIIRCYWAAVTGAVRGNFKFAYRA